jgi:hypothetical protein
MDVVIHYNDGTQIEMDMIEMAHDFEYDSALIRRQGGLRAMKAPGDEIGGAVGPPVG